MQGLVNFSTAIADSIAVLLPALCYLMACSCFFYFAWTLWTWSDSHSRYHHPHRARPWVPFASLILCGVFATFPKFLNMANVSAGTDLTVSLTAYSATTPPSASSVLGSTPDATVINVVTLFQYFFEVFGAASVAWAIVRFRSIVNAHTQGSPSSCLVQFVFGICCINILTIAKGVEKFFETGG